MAVVGLEQGGVQLDEVTRYETGRYISTNEASWRFFQFPIHSHFPAVEHLHVHVENGQRVYFTEDTAASVAAAPPKATTLTAFFSLCQHDGFAKTLLYVKVPTYYTWQSKTRSWSRRKRGANVPGYPQTKAAETISRVYTVHPRHSECFHLRSCMTTPERETCARDWASQIRMCWAVLTNILHRHYRMKRSRP